MFAAVDMQLCSACTQNRRSQRSVSGGRRALCPPGQCRRQRRPVGTCGWSADLPAVTAGQDCGDVVAGIWEVGQECCRPSHDAQNAPPPNQPPPRKLDSPMCQECQGKRCWSGRFHSSLVKAAMLSLFSILGEIMQT